MTQPNGDGGNGGTENGGTENAGTNNDTSQNGSTGNNGTGTQSEAKFTQADLDRVVNERLDRERKKYSDYGELKKQAQASKTLEQQVAELHAAQAERDAREVENAGRLATERLKTRLIRDGLADSDAGTIAASVDAMSLLNEGQPDDKAIDALGKSLAKAAGRAAPDPDQGRQSSAPPNNMNALIRNAVTRGRVR